MGRKPKFKRTIFEKFPWLNLILTISVTIIQIIVAITNGLQRKYFWMIFFILGSMIYIFLMIPMSYQLMKKTIQNNKDMKNLEKRIKERRKVEVMTFTEWMNKNWNRENMLPPPLDAQIAINFLEQYLLGKDWYIVNPLTNAQANVEIVHEILYRYSKEYKKEYKKEYRKNQKERRKDNENISKL